VASTVNVPRLCTVMLMSERGWAKADTVPGESVNILLKAFVVLTAAACATSGAQAQGFLDRIKKKADEAADSVRDVRGDVEAVTTVDERAAAEAAAAQREVDAATDVEGQARRAAADTELARDARGAAADAARVGSTDERIEAEARAETAAGEREVRNATDFEGQAERGVRQSDAGRAVVQTERDVDRIAQTDERVQAAAERRVDGALGVSEAERNIGQTEQGVREAGRALDDLESALE
jgi:hypothetical protein